MLGSKQARECDLAPVARANPGSIGMPENNTADKGLESTPIC